MKFKVDEDCFDELSVGDEIDLDGLGEVKVVERTERTNVYELDESVFVVTVENPNFNDLRGVRRDE